MPIKKSALVVSFLLAASPSLAQHGQGVKDHTWLPPVPNMSDGTAAVPNLGPGSPTLPPQVAAPVEPEPVKPKGVWVFAHITGSYCNTPRGPGAMLHAYAISCLTDETDRAEPSDACGPQPATTYPHCSVYYTGQGTCDLSGGLHLQRTSDMIEQTSFVPSGYRINAGPYSFAAQSKSWNSPYCK